jgi:hypothetical protein
VSVLAAWLVGVGVADLVRGVGRFRRRPLRLASLFVAVLLTVAVGALAGLASGTSLVVLLLSAALAGAWILVSGRALGQGRRSGLALTVLAFGAGTPLVLSGLTRPAAGPLERWLEWTTVPQLHELSADRFLLVTGLFLAQLSTGNALVRLILASIGAIRPPGQPQPADRLRGGRLLGPLERVFILGLGLAGQVTAAGIVIAAKGLIRWPELQVRPEDLREAGDRHVGIDAVTEYFLVGSLVSWLLALGALWLGYS